MSFKDDLKYNVEQDLVDMLGLTDNKNSLEYDLKYGIENGIDKYNRIILREQEKTDEIKNIVLELLNDKAFISKLIKILEYDGFVKDCPTCYWNIKKYGKLK